MWWCVTSTVCCGGGMLDTKVGILYRGYMLILGRYMHPQKNCVINTLVCPQKRWLRLIHIVMTPLRLTSQNFKISSPQNLNLKVSKLKITKSQVLKLQAQNLKSQNFKISNLRISNLKISKSQISQFKNLNHNSQIWWMSWRNYFYP